MGGKKLEDEEEWQIWSTGSATLLPFCWHVVIPGLKVYRPSRNVRFTMKLRLKATGVVLSAVFVVAMLGLALWHSKPPSVRIVAAHHLGSGLVSLDIRNGAPDRA